MIKTLSLFSRLSSGAFSKEDGFDELKNRSKFVARTIFTSPWSWQWLTYATQNNYLQQSLAKMPRLALKLHRPYICSQFSTAFSLNVLKTHYQIMPQVLSNMQLGRLLAGEQLTVGEAKGKDDFVARFYLAQRHSFDKEGELALCIVNGDNIPMATLTFSVFEDAKAGRQLVIGGLQGPRKKHGHEHIRIATKALHGIFPKRLVLETITLLAVMWQCKNIIAVSNKNHVYSAARYQREFSADYDAFWESLGGVLREDGLFALPLEIARKEMAEIASKKRSEYQKRYATLDALKEDVLNRAGG